MSDTYMAAPWTTPAGIGYMGLFFFTGVACVASIPRARTFGDIEVQYGLVGLLGFTGVWALLKTAFFIVPVPLQEVVYATGLISGFAAVWAWLYFASAYTGRGLHRNPTLRRLGGAVFLTITAVKLTNPVHGLYFTTILTDTPFRHLAIEHGIIHWISTSLSYVLAAIGLFMIFELYIESGYDTKPLAVLTAMLALPVTIDIVAVATGSLINFIYAPIGVAVFAVGALFIFGDQLLAVRTRAQGDEATIVLDDNDRIQAYSSPAKDAFPELDGATGDPLEDVLPTVGTIKADDENRIVEREGDDGPRYYFASLRSMTLGNSAVRIIALSDVTEFERQRRDLIQRERKLNERNELYRAVISASFAFVFRINPDGSFNFVSPSVEEFVGYTSEELTGESISILVADDEQIINEAYEYLDTVVDNGEAVQVRDFPLETRSGDTVYVDVQLEPIYDPSVEPDTRTPDGVVGVQSMVRDASERRKREGLISVINRVLRHNVRNKLTVIKGQAEILAATLNGDDASRADRITKAGTRLLNLSESARRIETNRELSPELEPLDIVPIIKELLAQLDEEYSTASTTAELPDSAVAGTQPRIETALWELLDNAAQHAGMEPTIDVTVTATDDRISIEISDDGPGIPEMEQEVLATGKEEPLVHGDGLGLFLTYWIITNLDGEISITTTNRGTTVDIHLPTPSAKAAAGKQPP